MMTKAEIRKAVESILVEEIEFLKQTNPKAMVELIAWLDSEDKKAINVYLKKNDLWRYTKNGEL
jgi:hypothetical protein